MQAIVAVDKNWAIGRGGQLLLPIKDDLRRFRFLTQGKILVYGRKTLESFPGGRPLPGRLNIILSSLRRDWQPPFEARLAEDEEEAARPLLNLPGVEIVASLPLLAARLRKIPSSDVFVIGGASVYRQLLPYTEYVYVTEIDRIFTDCDSYFPRLTDLNEWNKAEEADWLDDAAGAVRFRYVTYRQNAPQRLEELL